MNVLNSVFNKAVVRVCSIEGKHLLAVFPSMCHLKKNNLKVTVKGVLCNQNDISLTCSSEKDYLYSQSKGFSGTASFLMVERVLRLGANRKTKKITKNVPVLSMTTTGKQSSFLR